MFFFFKFFLFSFVLLKINFCFQDNLLKTKVLNHSEINSKKNEIFIIENEKIILTHDKYYETNSNKNLENNLKLNISNKSEKNNLSLIERMVEPIKLKNLTTKNNLKINYTTNFKNSLIDSSDRIKTIKNNSIEENSSKFNYSSQIDNLKKSNNSQIIKDFKANNNQYSNSTTENLFKKPNKNFLNDASQILNNNLKEKTFLVTNKDFKNKNRKKKNFFYINDFNNSQVKRKNLFSNSDLEKIYFSKNFLSNLNLSSEKLYNLSKTTIPNRLKNFNILTNEGTTAIVSKKTKNNHFKKDLFIKKTTQPFLETTFSANMDINFLDKNNTNLNNKNNSLINYQKFYPVINFTTPYSNLSTVSSITEASFIFETNTIKPLIRNESFSSENINPYLETNYSKLSTSSYLDSVYPYSKTTSLIYDTTELNLLTTTTENIFYQNLSAFNNLYTTSNYLKLKNQLIENTIHNSETTVLSLNTNSSNSDLLSLFTATTKENPEALVEKTELNSEYPETTIIYQNTSDYNISKEENLNLYTTQIFETTDMSLKTTKIPETNTFFNENELTTYSEIATVNFETTENMNSSLQDLKTTKKITETNDELFETSPLDYTLYFDNTTKNFTDELETTTKLTYTTFLPKTSDNETLSFTTTNIEDFSITQSSLLPEDSTESTKKTFLDEELQKKLKELNYTLKFDPIGSDVLLIFENFTIPAKSELLANYSQIKYETNLYLVKYKFYDRVYKEKLESLSYDYDPQKGFLVPYDFLVKLIDANVNTIECELIYTLDNETYKSVNQIFTLILTNENSDFVNSYFYKLYSSNSTVVKAKVNDTIKLECFAVTYKQAPSKNGFIWRKRTLNKDWDFKKYQDSKQLYQASELLFRNSMNDTLLEFKVIRTQLIISEIDLMDTGYHYCEYDSDAVRKSHGIYVEVLDVKSNEQNALEENSFVSFESEHGTTNPLVIKFKETFHLRVKLNFNEICNVTILWVRKMKHILAKPVVINGISGLSNTVFHTIDSAEIKDSGDYALLVIKNLPPDSKLLFDIQKNFISNFVKKNSMDVSLLQANLYNNLKEYEINIKTLLVRVEGSVELSLFKSEKFYLNNYYSAVCHVFSTVPTNLHWKWSNCKTDEECDQNPDSWMPIQDYNFNKLLLNKNLSSKDFSGNNETIFKMIALNNEQINVLDFKFQKEVSYACISESSFGKSNVTFRTIPSEVDLSISASEKKIFTNDNLTLKCEGIFHQKPNLVWLYQKNENSSSVVLAEKTTKNYFISYTNEKKELEEFQHEYIRDYLEFIRYKNYYFSESKLFFQGLQSNQNGLYHCKNEINNKESALHLLTVQTLVMPKIKSFDRINLTSKIILICKYIGNPEPKVNWYKDGEFFNITVVSDAFESKIVLDLETIKTEESFYGCEVSNRWGKDRKNILVQFKNQKNNPKKDDKNPFNEENHSSKPNKKEKQTSTRDSISINYFFISFIVFAIVIIFFTVYKRKFTFNKTNNFFVKKKKTKKNLGFAFYNNSAYENELSDIINASNNNSQLNKLLKSIEFTEDRLDLGRVIGQGAYGIVVKAEAIGIEKSIKITTVAVKMLKDQYSIEQRNSLISEVHTLLVLGKHLNIVNLLGIVTKSKLMVIVEYCRYGNIKNFLFSNRSNFVNMVMKNGDLEITHEDVKGESSNSSIDSGFSIKTPLKTLDLVNFIFQISRGMQYIHSKKLLHRDLAARNVLLADDFVVKICDFGLSEDVYFDSDYIKKGHAKLPIKWMAYESIVDQLFTTKSDVWSFAVVCWEIFTMGSDPYPGIPTDEHFHKKLKEGYRMERSEQCPREIYEIMSKCWHKESEERPTFEELSVLLYEILDSSTRNCYVDVNIS